MEYAEVKDLLQALCSLNGTSGNETSVADKVKEMLAEFMPCHTDRLGNVIGSKGKGFSILLDAHIDQIGLVATGIDDDGFVRTARVGGADCRVLTAQQVIIHGKEDVYGIIPSVPPHLKKDGDEGKVPGFDDIAIDIGMSKSQAENIISPGDRITFISPFDTLLNNRVSSGCIDDRAGVAAILRCLQLLKEKNTCRLDVMFSVQEETGGSGAVVGAYNSQADEAIACDVSFACAPGVSSEKYVSLGSGTMVGYAPSLDYEMSKKLTSIALEKGIPHTAEVMGGSTGTNGDDIQISGRGIKTALLSIPIRNMHTCVEVADLADIENTAKLMAEYILKRSAENA